MASRPLRWLALPLTLLLLADPVGVRAQLDSTFVEIYDHKARINGGLKFRERGTVFSVENREDFRLENRGLALRFGGRYRWLGYTFSLPISDLGTGGDREEGRSFGLGLQLFRPKYYVVGRFRNTRGFRSERPGGSSTFREDVGLFTATVFGFHILSHRQFSLRSSFRQRGRQVRDKGSWLIGGLVNRQVFTADSITIPLSESRNARIDRFAQTKLGVGVGYAYTHLFSPEFYVTPMAIVGPEFRFIDYEGPQVARVRENFRVSPRLRGRLAFGYNGRCNFAAITGAYLPSLDATDNLDTRIRYLEVELRIGRRL